MARFWFSWAQKEGEEVGFARRAVAAVMTCFFDCFRTDVSYTHLNTFTSDSMMTRGKDELSSLDLCNDDSLQNGREAGKPLLEELDVRELKDEAKFLKACGTLLQTPVEIREASRKWAYTSAQSKEEKSWTFKSWLPNASLEKLKIDEQPDESPPPVRICEEWVTWTGFSADSPCSIADECITRRDSISSIQNVVTPMAYTTTVNRKNKSVRFDCESDTSTFSSKDSPADSSSLDSERSALAANFTLPNSSPYPTPLKLTDNMQTPGTVFPSYMKNIADGRSARIRSQYVYSVSNPINYPSQGKLLNDENSDPNHQIESLKLNDEATSTSTPILNQTIKDILVGQDMKGEASLSSWLKPQSENQDGNNKLFVPISEENVQFGRTSEMVAVHSSGQVTSSISQSSIDKYKENQKVASHATPFEERLEEALSGVTFASPRKP